MDQYSRSQHSLIDGVWLIGSYNKTFCLRDLKKGVMLENMLDNHSEVWGAAWRNGGLTPKSHVSPLQLNLTLNFHLSIRSKHEVVD